MVAESPLRPSPPTTTTDQARRWAIWAAVQCGMSEKDIRRGPRWQMLPSPNSRRAPQYGRRIQQQQLARAQHLHRCQIAWYMHTHPWPETNATATLVIISAGMNWGGKDLACKAIKTWTRHLRAAINLESAE